MILKIQNFCEKKIIKKFLLKKLNLEQIRIKTHLPKFLVGNFQEFNTTKFGHRRSTVLIYTLKMKIKIKLDSGCLINYN